MDQIKAWFTNYQADLARIEAFWQGEGRYLVSVHVASHSYRQCFDDKAVLAAAPAYLQAQAQQPGVNWPALFADWGTISTAKYWGGVPRFDSTGGNIFVDAVAETLEQALQIDPFPVDHPTQDAWRAVQLWRVLSERLDSDWLWLRTPDMQGTLNTAGLIVRQEELLIGMYSAPDLVHALLERVSDLLIAYACYLRRETGGRVCGNIWPYTFFPAHLGVALTEDLMPLLSADLYQEYGIPYLRKIQAALGSLHIHCCGDWGRHATNLARSGLDIRAVEFHDPATTIQELAPLADRTVFIPYIILDRQTRFSRTVDYYRYLLQETPQHYRYWFACADDSPDMIEFAQEYGDTVLGGC